MIKKLLDTLWLAIIVVPMLVLEVAEDLSVRIFGPIVHVSHLNVLFIGPPRRDSCVRRCTAWMWMASRAGDVEIGMEDYKLLRRLLEEGPVTIGFEYGSLG